MPKDVKPRILVVDDEEIMRNLLRDMLTDRGYEVLAVHRAEDAISAFKSRDFDLTITDIRMPGMDGIELIRQVKSIDKDSVIIVITGYGALESAQEALRLGAYDYITKPFAIDEIEFVIRRGVAARRLILENRRLGEYLKEENVRLDEKVKERTRQLQDTYLHTVTSLVSAIDAKDTYTRNHSESVSRWGVLVAKEMGLSADDVELVRLAGQLHDVGKIGIEDKILTKPDKLTPDEWEIMKRHSTIAADILAPLDFLKDVTRIVKENHERYDGKGYPDGLKGEEISLGARIMAVSDAYDTMTSKRPYREIMPMDKVTEELRRNSGVQFDPKVIEVFLKLLKEGKIVRD